MRMIDLPPCASDIAEHYGVPYEMVAAVRVVEGGKVGVRNGPRFNGSFDLGPMQINSWWFQDHKHNLTKRFGITEHDVQYKYCSNIAVGVWILAKNLNAYGNDWSKALSAYNTGSPDGSKKYPEKVFSTLKGINRTTLNKPENN